MKDFKEIQTQFAEILAKTSKQEESFTDSLDKVKNIWQESIKNKDLFISAINALKDNRELSVSDILSVDDLTIDDIELIFKLTYSFKNEFIGRNSKKISLLKGKSIINFFAEESTRTRTSFELAAKHLSADTINISKSSSSMAKKGETLNDTVRTLDAMETDLIIFRHSKAGSAKMIAKEIRTPIINAGDGIHEHPTQALLDVFTIWEKKGQVENQLVLIVGDIKHSRVAGSLLLMLNNLKANIRICAPTTLIPQKFEKVFKAEVFTELDEAIKDVDVIYVLRPQKERAMQAYIPTIREYAKRYVINSNRLKLAKKDAIVMHPGPINREIDIRTEVMDGPQSVVEEQVTNGFALRMVLCWLLINKKSDKQKYM